MPSIAQLLPLPGKDHEQKCIKLGIIRRAREIKMPADLMMLCLFHPLNGVSLVAVSTVAFANEYIVVVTLLPDSVTADEVLETYRRRWQVEIHFKRLKSIPGFGDLPKKNPAASQAWLNGKIMVALLIEAFIAKASFSPGNPIKYRPQYMA
jgi:transposase